ncbi:MAG: glycosyltransferase family 2 protein [Candidatus Dormibacteria bacterium]
MKVSVIIPSKNRASVLADTLETLLSQTCIPDEIVIVDQSVGDETKKAVANFAERVRLSGSAKPEFLYLYDPNLIGAGAARNIAIDRSSGEILVFLDDDVLLEHDFLQEMLLVYQQNSDVGGVSGVITNYPAPPWARRFWDALFYIGPFHDERQPIYWNCDRLRQAKPIPVRRFGSGLMSVKRSSLNGDRFDDWYKGAGPEDVDLTWRLSERCPLVITPQARLVHVRTSVDGPREHWLSYSVKSQYYLYHRLWNTGVANRLCFAWLNFGYALLATTASLRHFSFAPWRAFKAGIRGAEEILSRGSRV